DTAKVAATIRAARAAGARRIAIVGPTPEWFDPLPRTLYNFFRTDPLHRVPNRMTYGSDPAVWMTEARLQAAIRGLPVDYISSLAALCDPSGCLTRLGDRATQLSAYDIGHLTSAGSVFLMQAVSPQL